MINTENEYFVVFTKVFLYLFRSFPLPLFCWVAGFFLAALREFFIRDE